ncbi:MAG TPA: beta-ketoacyl-ACP synthase 3 [Atopostipes sp.]|nr:beta-ketoacyl-ACP synthase 3 [Atopostipes sp.]
MSKIVATGSYLPEKVISNTELIEQTGIDSSDEWITQRTGIQQRHFSSEKETVSDIAVKAAENLLKQLDAEIVQDIQLIIVATMSSRLPTPSVANQVQRALGIEQAWAFDVSGACSGFVMALEVAEKLSRDKSSGYTLVIGAEKMSDILNFEDRGTSILFGDGAGAVLIEHDGKGLPNYQSSLTSLPDPENSIHVPTEETPEAQMTMAGREVFNFVLRQVIPSLSDFINVHAKDFDYLISHQANYRFIEIIAKKLKVSLDKIPANIDKVANTSAGSIPILLDQLVKEDTIHLNGKQKVVFVGYGAGLAWGQISIVI